MASGDPGRPLRIRMYDIGFGDCFLLYVPDGDETRLVLLDFGRHLSSTAGNTLSKVGKDLTREAKKHHGGTPTFDVVIATHRHFDHIAGFDLADAKKFEAGEVWLPWTEDPDDPKAVDLKQRQFDLARALGAALDRAGADEDRDRYGDLLANSHPDTVGFQLSNNGAMENLLGGLANGAPRKFLPEQEPDPTPAEDGSTGMRDVRTMATEHLPGVTVHVLGPSHDPDVISKLKPPDGEFYKFVDDRPAAAGRRERSSLFRDQYRLRGRAKRQMWDAHAFDELKRRARDIGFSAKKLEDMVNGTSLVLVLEIGQAVIVLGGDAEWGTWEQILDDDHARELLGRTTVYKVSHHGSYNGTPRRYVQELMPPTAVSLVSLCAMERWPSIPRASLLADLEIDDRQLVRTDRPARGGVIVERTDLFTEIAVPI